jgi:hypothetical protein
VWSNPSVFSKRIEKQTLSFTFPTFWLKGSGAVHAPHQAIPPGKHLGTWSNQFSTGCQQTWHNLDKWKFIQQMLTRTCPRNWGQSSEQKRLTYSQTTFLTRGREAEPHISVPVLEF